MARRYIRGFRNLAVFLCLTLSLSLPASPTGMNAYDLEALAKELPTLSDEALIEKLKKDEGAGLPNRAADYIVFADDMLRRNSPGVWPAAVKLWARFHYEHGWYWEYLSMHSAPLRIKCWSKDQETRSQALEKLSRYLAAWVPPVEGGQLPSKRRPEMAFDEREFEVLTAFDPSSPQHVAAWFRVLAHPERLTLQRIESVSKTDVGCRMLLLYHLATGGKPEGRTEAFLKVGQAFDTACTAAPFQTWLCDNIPADKAGTELVQRVRNRYLNGSWEAKWALLVYDAWQCRMGSKHRFAQKGEGVQDPVSGMAQLLAEARAPRERIFPSMQYLLRPYVGLSELTPDSLKLLLTFSYPQLDQKQRHEIFRCIYDGTVVFRTKLKPGALEVLRDWAQTVAFDDDEQRTVLLFREKVKEAIEKRVN